VKLRIVGTELPGRDCGANGNFPGYTNIHVGVQRKNRPDQLLDLHPGDAARAVWSIDCSVDGTDVRGPYIQGPPGGRFIYLNWGTVDDGGRFSMFRRGEADALRRAARHPRVGCRLGVARRQPRSHRRQGPTALRPSAAAADYMDCGRFSRIAGC
jgi:Family of unknown function (DUF5990)